MTKITQRILTILLIIAVLIYVAYNYMTSKSDLSIFLVSTAMLLFFLIGMIRGLIQDLKNR